MKKRSFWFPILLGVLWLALIGSTMTLAQRAQGISTYKTGPIVEPVVSALCPGERLIYEQNISIEETTMIDVSRDWCNRGSTCIMALHETFENVVVVPINFIGEVSHVVPPSPSWKPGGLYEFRSGVRNGELSVQIVEFQIRTNCP